MSPRASRGIFTFLSFFRIRHCSLFLLLTKDDMIRMYARHPPSRSGMVFAMVATRLSSPQAAYKELMINSGLSL